VDFSGCEKYLDTPVKRYSSGMMVRLGFAVAAHLDPEILVVDEVLAVGDAEFQKKAIGKMQDVSKGEGRTVLFVSHNMTSVRQLCNTGVLLENGCVSFRGNIEDTINNYLSINTSEIDYDQLISDRTDRRGTGKMHVTNVVFRKLDGDQISELFIGEYLKIEISFTKDDDVDLRDMIVSCGFEDMYGNRANEWVSDEMEHDFTNIQNGKISLVVPSMTMRPNNYYFHFKLMLKDTSDNNIADAMHFVKQLHIIPYSFYTDGMCLREGRGYEAIVPAIFQN
jgi:lipopolysaccharide transport system ATP-binding protein